MSGWIHKLSIKKAEPILPDLGARCIRQKTREDCGQVPFRKRQKLSWAYRTNRIKKRNETHQDSQRRALSIRNCYRGPVWVNKAKVLHGVLKKS